MKKFLLSILIIILIGIAVFSIYHLVNEKEETLKEKDNTVEKDDTPKEDEPYQNETKLIDKYSSEEEAKEVELKYDQYITANGYSGASDNVYYTRNGVLYHLVISTEETTKLAEGVKKIENDLDCMRAYKGENFKLIEEDEYVIYVD